MNTHYFNQEAIDSKQYIALKGKIGDDKLKLYSQKGLFSYDKFDLGTRILLKYHTLPDQNDVRLLDLGCGYGLVSTYIADQYNRQLYPYITTLHIDACDIAPGAVQVTDYNLNTYKHTPGLSYHVQHSDILSDSYFGYKTYDSIILNPPFHAGKSTVKKCIIQAYEHLMPTGILRIVIPTHKGAKSYIAWTAALFGSDNNTIASIEAGYRVWKISKPNKK